MKFGDILWKDSFSRSIAGKYGTYESWGVLRNGLPLLLDGSANDAFRALQGSGDEKLWKWASSEPQMQQHPITGDTVFHLLCGSESFASEQKLAVLEDFKLHCRNPLVPNYR